LVGATVLRVSTAWAGDPDLERARALFDEAGELERHGQWSAAQEKIRQAMRLRETPQLHYALGWALENDDKLIEARAEYETTVKQGQNRSGSEQATRLAKERLNELEQKMPTIKVRVTGGSRSSARVVVDGKEVKREDDTATALVNPGSHVIRVERAGTDESIEQMAYVGRGTVRTIDVDTGDAVTTKDTTQERHAAAPLRMSKATTTDKEDPHGKLVPFLLIGSGAAAILGGSALLIASASDASDRDDAQAKWCTATACQGTRATITETPEAASYRRQAQDAADAGNAKQAVGIVLTGVGVVAAGIGAYIFMNDRDTNTTRAAQATVRPSVSPLPGGGYASATLSF
jgi:hypothetical protein